MLLWQVNIAIDSHVFVIATCLFDRRRSFTSW